MMLSIKGTFRNGVAQPSHPIDDHDGQMVIITFLDDDQRPTEPEQHDSDWDVLDKLVSDCEVKTGISDFAHEHDHYIRCRICKI